MMNSPKLGEMWTPLRYHPEQWRLWNSRARFRIVPAGRRSGKTELAMRFLVFMAMIFGGHPNGWFVLAAPTIEQARRIFWDKLKALIPRVFVASINETRLTVRLVNGVEITVLGLDKPERIEGRPLDGIVMDEYGNMKPDAWDAHVGPSLSTVGRLGWAWLIGVPEGRNHYWKLYNLVCSGSMPEWEAFHWKSADILDPNEIANRRKTMDPILFAQEYEADFVSFSGNAYYGFKAARNCERLRYMKHLPLILQFDFNVTPGIALIAQDQPYYPKEPKRRPEVAREITAWIGEVWIARNSTTEMVCERVMADWGHHEGPVYCYGDPTGGNRHCSNADGESNWDIIRRMLRKRWKDVRFRVDRQPGPERPRVNALNSRFYSVDGTIAGLVDPVTCPRFVEDLQTVVVVEGSDGALDKKSKGMEMFTHMSDAAGYFVHRAHNPNDKRTRVDELLA